jgi:hypothetical protein
MAKVDLRRQLKQFYLPSAKVITEVQVPAFTFLMVDGQGDPNHSVDYTEAVEALFTVACTAKFMLRKTPGGCDYAVMPLEGLWWADDPAAFQNGDRASWRWTMMILQPDFVPRAMLQAAAKKKLPALPRLRIERLHACIGERGQLQRKHHEIYLSDIRRADPSRWKTIIRQPMVRQPLE